MLTAEILFMLLIGHCIGDFLLQPNILALNKKKNTVYGWIACLAHCGIYTGVVTTAITCAGYVPSFTQVFLIFLTHFIIDKTLLLDLYMRVMKIRSWDTYISNPDSTHAISVNQAVRVSFGAIVYVVSDNTLHLLSMYIILKYV